MKSAEVVLALVFVAISVCNGSVLVKKLTNDGGNSVTEESLDDTTVTNDPLENATTKNASEDDSTVTYSYVPSYNETATTVQSITSGPPATQKSTTTPIVNQHITTAPSVNKTSTPSGGRRRLSTEVDKSKCESLGIEVPNAAECKCYKQKSAGTDTPQGFCFYFECAGTPPTLSVHKCEWVNE